MHLRQMAMAIFLTFAGAGGALAHSPLADSTPEAGSELREAPVSMTLFFAGPMRLTRVTLARDGGEKTPLEISVGDFATDYEIPLGITGPGEYVLGWRGISADGHVLSGEIPFRVAN